MKSASATRTDCSKNFIPHAQTSCSAACFDLLLRDTNCPHNLLYLQYLHSTQNIWKDRESSYASCHTDTYDVLAIYLAIQSLQFTSSNLKAKNSSHGVKPKSSISLAPQFVFFLTTSNGNFLSVCKTQVRLVFLANAFLLYIFVIRNQVVFPRIYWWLISNELAN